MPPASRLEQIVMAKIEARLTALGLVLPPAFMPQPGVVVPFVNVRLIGNRAVIAGHGPQSPEGPLAQPLGKVGRELTLEQGYMAAKLTALSMLGYLKRELGDLDRISHWVRIFGMVNSAPGFVQQPAVINGFSDLILELFGPEAGAHARSAVGMAELPRSQLERRDSLTDRRRTDRNVIRLPLVCRYLFLKLIPGPETAALHPAARRRVRAWVAQPPRFPIAPGLPPSAADFG